MVYCAFIEGQGGELTSLGMVQMQAAAQKSGIRTDLFAYSQIANVIADLTTNRQMNHKLAVVGYSLGSDTAALASQKIPLDLLISLDPSRLAIHHMVGKKTKRSILYHNSNWLSRATGIGAAGERSDPGGDLGYHIKIEIDENHLAVDFDPAIQAEVLKELVALNSEH